MNNLNEMFKKNCLGVIYVDNNVKTWFLNDWVRVHSCIVFSKFFR